MRFWKSCNQEKQNPITGKKGYSKMSPFDFSVNIYFATKMVCTIPKNYKFDICHLQKKFVIFLAKTELFCHILNDSDEDFSKMYNMLYIAIIFWKQLSFNDSQMQMLNIKQWTADFSWISCWYTASAVAAGKREWQRLFNVKLWHLWIKMTINMFCK